MKHLLCVTLLFLMLVSPVFSEDFSYLDPEYGGITLDLAYVPDGPYLYSSSLDLENNIYSTINSYNFSDYFSEDDREHVVNSVWTLTDRGDVPFYNDSRSEFYVANGYLKVQEHQNQVNLEGLLAPASWLQLLDQFSLYHDFSRRKAAYLDVFEKILMSSLASYNSLDGDLQAVIAEETSWLDLILRALPGNNEQEKINSLNVALEADYSGLESIYSFYKRIGATRELINYANHLKKIKKWNHSIGDSIVGSLGIIFDNFINTTEAARRQKALAGLYVARNMVNFEGYCSAFAEAAIDNTDPAYIDAWNEFGPQYCSDKGYNALFEEISSSIANDLLLTNSISSIETVVQAGITNYAIAKGIATNGFLLKAAIVAWSYGEIKEGVQILNDIDNRTLKDALISHLYNSIQDKIDYKESLTFRHLGFAEDILYLKRLQSALMIYIWSEYKFFIEDDNVNYFSPMMWAKYAGISLSGAGEFINNNYSYTLDRSKILFNVDTVMQQISGKITLSTDYYLDSIFLDQNGVYGFVGGFIKSSNDSEATGIVSFQVDNQVFSSNVVVTDEGYYFSKNFYLPETAQTTEVIFTSAEGSEARTTIAIPAKTDQGEEEVPPDDPSQPGTSLQYTELTFTDSSDGQSTTLSGYVKDDQGNNPFGTATLTTPSGSTWRSFGIGSDSRGSYFYIDTIDKSAYPRLETLTIETYTGLNLASSVSVPGTSDEPAPNPSFQFIEPNNNSKWRIGIPHTFAWNSVSIDPDYTYRFNLYSPGGSFVQKLGLRGANHREETWTFDNVVDGTYKIGVVIIETEELLAFSETFALTDYNDTPVTKNLEIVAFSGQQTSNIVWFDEPNDDPTILSISSAPTKGTVSLQQTGSFTYTANADVTGADSFKVLISDGALDVEAVVGVTIIDENSLADFEFTNGWNHGDTINDIAVSNGLIYTAGDDDTIRIYDYQGNQVDALSPGNSGFVKIAVGEGYIAAIDYSEELYVFSEETRSLLRSPVDLSSANATDLVIGEGHVYVSFGSSEIKQVQRYNLATGMGAEFSYDTGEYYNDGDDIECIYFYRFPRVGNDIIFFTGTDGGDEELHWWEEEGATGYKDGDENFGDDVTAVFARDGFLYGGDSGGDLTKMAFTGTTFDEYGTGAYQKYGLHTNDIVAIYSDGSELFTGSHDYSVKIWKDSDASLKQIISTATTANGHTDRIVGLAYSDGYLVTADTSGYIKIWSRNFIPTVIANDIVTWSDLSVSTALNVVDLDSSDVHTFSVSIPPQNGSANVDDNGIVTYVPTPGYCGVDSVGVDISDGKDTASTTVGVAVKNRPPAASIETSGFNGVGTIGYLITLNGVGNDPEADPISAYQWALVSKPEASTVALNSTSVSSTSFNPDVVGIYTFSLKVSDGTTFSQLATIDVPVINSPPEAIVAGFSASANTASSAFIVAGDPNSNDTHTFSVLSQPDNGIVEVSAMGIISFTPATDFIGGDSFEIGVTDNWGAVSSVVVNFTVENSAPVALNRSIQIDVDQTYEGSLIGYDTNGDSLEYRIKATSTHGTFGFIDSSSGEFNYTPMSGFEGEDRVSFVVYDGYVESEVAELLITVEASPVDSDSDGVPDDSDQCSDTPQGTPVNEVGCPLSLTSMGAYPLDGSAVDTSGNSYDGVEVNGVTYVSGLSEQAAAFNGIDDYIDLPEEAVNADSGTVSLWFNVNTQHDGFVFSSANTSSPSGTRRYIMTTSEGAVRGMFASSVLGDSAITPGQWNHAVLTWDETSSGFYHGGGLVGTGPGGNPIPENVNLGSYGEGYSSFYNGLIDDVRIYDRVLSPTEIMELYHDLVPEQPPQAMPWLILLLDDE